MFKKINSLPNQPVSLASHEKPSALEYMFPDSPICWTSWPQYPLPHTLYTVLLRHILHLDLSHSGHWRLLL
jgi:hypothetical protein